MTKKEKQAVYCLRDDTSIIIKESDKNSGTVIWDIEDYLAEVRTPLEDFIPRQVYQDLTDNESDPLMKIIESLLRKERNRKYISDEALDYFWLATLCLVDFTYFQRYTKVSVMCLEGLLYLIRDTILKTCQTF